MQKKIAIQNKHNQKTLYEGTYKNIRQCLESAVEQHMDLSHADLRGLNLSNCNLDDARLDQADFTGSNLTGANLSEASLKNAVFRNTTLVDACLSYSDLSSAAFENARFGATDITGANLTRAAFAALSCFSLDFAQARTVQNAFYIHFNRQCYTMNGPPKVIYGLLNTPIIIIGPSILVGHQAFSYEQLNVYSFLERLIKINMQNIY